MGKKVISMTITEEAHKRLKTKAKAKGVSVSTLIQLYAMRDEKGENMKEKALRRLYDALGIDSPDYEEDQAHDYLTENEARNGRGVLWYMDENHNAAIYMDTLELLTAEEIEEQLA